MILDYRGTEREGSALFNRMLYHAAERGDTVAYQQIPQGDAAPSVLTYRQLKERVSAFFVRHGKTYKPDSVILFRCPNTYNYPIGFFGILAMGCHVFPLSVDLTDIEVEEAVRTSNA